MVGEGGDWLTLKYEQQKSMFRADKDMFYPIGPVSFHNVREAL